jgi:hypothetical protein
VGSSRAGAGGGVGTAAATVLSDLRAGSRTVSLARVSGLVSQVTSSRAWIAMARARSSKGLAEGKRNAAAAR